MRKTAMRRSYGTHPDIPDHRDHHYEAPRSVKTRLPKSVDLRPHFPSVYEQKTLNSCSANAIAAAIWFEDLRDGGNALCPSRLFIYYNERAHERKIHENVPVSLRDGYKSVVREGVCSEKRWPYHIKKFQLRPPKHAYAEAKQRRVLAYQRVRRDLQQMKACLAQHHPIALGMSAYAEMEGHHVRRTGRVEMPKRGERLLGGHAVLMVGYHDASQRFILRNSWGRRWGLDGYFTLPYEFVMHESLAWDFWTIRKLES